MTILIILIPAQSTWSLCQAEVRAQDLEERSHRITRLASSLQEARKALGEVRETLGPAAGEVGLLSTCELSL
jgi:hypothetical protein